MDKFDEKKKEELRKIIYEEEYPDITTKVYKKKDYKPTFTNMILSLMMVCALFFSCFLVIDSFNRINALYEIINAGLFFLCIIGIVISFPKSFFKKKTGGTIYLSFMVIVSIIFNGLYLFNIIKLPTQNHIIDYTNKNLNEAASWADKNEIDYNEEFEYSDTISKYNIISQSVKGGALTKNIKDVSFIVSNGPDYEKTVIIPDQSGLTTSDILEFTDENFLKNVSIVFEENDSVKNDLIISQSNTGKVKRSDSIIYTASLGIKDELSSFKLKDLKGEKLLNAVVYLGKNGVLYELKYEYSSSILRGRVISSDIKKGTTLKADDKVTLTISKGKEIKVPNFNNMNLKDVSKWIIQNNLNMEYSDKYSDDVKKGKVISSNYEKDSVIEEETLVNFVFSKGPLIMPKFKDLSSFKEWASKYEIKYEIKEEFSKDVPKDQIIKFSVKTGEKIKLDDPLEVYVSKGESVVVSDFTGKQKSEVQNECNSLGIICEFYSTLSDKNELSILSQSISVGMEIAKGDKIEFEVATKKQSEVTTKKKSSSSNSSSSSNNTPSNPSSGSQSSNPPSTPSNNCTNATYISASGNNGEQSIILMKKYNSSLNISFISENSCSNGSTTSGSICYAQNSSTGAILHDGDTVSTCDSIFVHYIK